jgi:hypothetical protein
MRERVTKSRVQEDSQSDEASKSSRLNNSKVNKQKTTAKVLDLKSKTIRKETRHSRRTEPKSKSIVAKEKHSEILQYHPDLVDFEILKKFDLQTVFDQSGGYGEIFLPRCK